RGRDRMHDAARRKVIVRKPAILSGAAFFLMLFFQPAIYAGELQAAEAIPLRYAQAYSSLRSIFSLRIVIGDRQGFFRREGLDFRVGVPVRRGGDKMIRALRGDTGDSAPLARRSRLRPSLAGSGAVAIAAAFT